MSHTCRVCGRGFVKRAALRQHETDVHIKQAAERRRAVLPQPTLPIFLPETSSLSLISYIDHLARDLKL